MIQSISSNSSSALNVSTSISSVAQKNAEVKNAETAAVAATLTETGTPQQTVAESSQGDTLELSQQGVSQAKSVVQQAAANVVSSNTENTQNLSQYTAAELKKMVTSGKITQAEMDAELAQRTKNTSTDAKTSTDTNTNASTSTDTVTNTVTDTKTDTKINGKQQ